MTKPERFQHSQSAIERSALNGQQSLLLYESSQEIIERSKALMEILRHPQPIYKVGSE